MKIEMSSSVVLSFTYLVLGVEDVEVAKARAMERFRDDLERAGIEAKKTAVKRLFEGDYHQRVAVYATKG